MKRIVVAPRLILLCSLFSMLIILMSPNQVLSASITLPTVLTNAATNVTSTSATLNANLTSMGTFTSVSAYFRYGTTSSPTITSAATTKTQAGQYSNSLTNLTPNTTYYFHAAVLVSVIPTIVEGKDFTFTTLPAITATTTVTVPPPVTSSTPAPNPTVTMTVAPPVTSSTPAPNPTVTITVPLTTTATVIQSQTVTIMVPSTTTATTTTIATVTTATTTTENKAHSTPPWWVWPIIGGGLLLLIPILLRNRRKKPAITKDDQWEVTFVRPDDLVVCSFTLYNLKIETDASSSSKPKPKLVRQNPAVPSRIVMRLQPQSFGEQAFAEIDDPNLGSLGPFPETSKVRTKNVPNRSTDLINGIPEIRMSGPSRLAFTMPSDVKEIDFTAEGLLDACRRWPMELDKNAEPESLDTGPKYSAINVLGGNIALDKSLAESAQRISGQTGLAMNEAPTETVSASLVPAMLAEIDKLAVKYPQLRNPSQRDLALSALSTYVVANIKAARGPAATISQSHLDPQPPSPAVTALELPYRIILSPVPRSIWWHATQPVVHNRRTELWHTRLTQPPIAQLTAGIGPDLTTSVRAIWSDDYPANISGKPDITKVPQQSLDALDRQMLVKLMAGFNLKDNQGRPFTPHAACAHRLMLSSLGALLDVEGNWKQDGVALEQWRHLAAMGRDFYVRVVYRGNLMPFGHSASLIKVTERKFEDYTNPVDSSKGRIAVLRQRFFLVVRERIKDYDGTQHIHGGRNFPFKSVEVLTRTTPDLLAPDNRLCPIEDATVYINVPYRACFWPILTNKTGFSFQLAATDINGERVTFTMPLLFVGKEANEASPNVMVKIRASYNNHVSEARRKASMGNSSICYAPDDQGHNTSLPTREMTFAAGEATATVLPSQPLFYPEVESAKVGIVSIQNLLQQPSFEMSVTYPEVYKTNGFGEDNKGEVFLKALETTPLDFVKNNIKTDTLGALISPSMPIQGLSRVMGPVGAVLPPGVSSLDPTAIEQALGNLFTKFDPSNLFGDAKMLGAITLADLLGAVDNVFGDDTPKLTCKKNNGKIETTFTWETKLNKPDPTGIFVPNPDPNPEPPMLKTGQTKLSISGKASTPKPSATLESGKTAIGETTFTAEASLENFKINLFGCIIVWFDKLKFISKSGSKPDVSMELYKKDYQKAIEFGGPLEFVNSLKDYIPTNGFSDPPGLAVTPSGITADYSLNLPSVGIGILALENVSIGAKFALPFDSKPMSLRFDFCERQHPFTLTVGGLGGGGFFALALSTQGVEEIEAALEFGGAVSLDLGVASGGVEIKAGIYFHWNTQSVDLAGYVRLHGELSIIGLISASLTFNLQLSYYKDKANGKSVVSGEATLTIDIDILFFSVTVSIKCRREFGGSAGDPKFNELIEQKIWSNYCDAFASEEVADNAQSNS